VKDVPLGGIDAVTENGPLFLRAGMEWYVKNATSNYASECTKNDDAVW
jgi:hypothetical protein